ncbi:MAG: CoA pyrophosphatase [Leptothrix ochracea]|uniref:CoA pyrophosphatase n=1 Tax=Leptothrix ochracea TaxID=735331 RepID=UPI0034E2C51E
MPRPALIRDPRLIPVIATGAGQPSVPPERLRPQALRERFAQTFAWQPNLHGDGRVLPDRPLAQAAVLIALMLRPEGLTVLLTQRTAHLRDHAGQISFPGGRSEPEDADAVVTALREAQEEVGLSADRVEVLGCLPSYTTITAYRVIPVVALVTPPLHWQPDPQEVAEIFEVPLSFLMAPEHHQQHGFEDQGARRSFFSMPWPNDQGHFIWGATAGMLRNLYHFLRA